MLCPICLIKIIICSKFPVKFSYRINCPFLCILHIIADNVFKTLAFHYIFNDVNILIIISLTSKS